MRWEPLPSSTMPGYLDVPPSAAEALLAGRRTEAFFRGGPASPSPPGAAADAEEGAARNYFDFFYGATSQGRDPFVTLGAGDVEGAPAAPALRKGTPKPGGEQAIERLRKMLGQLWPHGFTLAILACYGVPTVEAVRLAREPSVQYWVGWLGYLALAIPVLLALAHGVHLRMGRPAEIPVIITTVVPAILLNLIATEHLAVSGNIGAILVSKDCMTHMVKQEVQHSWKVAANLYEGCVNRTTKEHKLPFSEGLRVLRLQDCAEVFAIVDGKDPFEEHRERWQYLRSMEEQYACSGWCWESAPLWTFQAVKDSCAATSGMVLLHRVGIVSSQIQCIAVLLGTVFALCTALLGVRLRRGGGSW